MLPKYNADLDGENDGCYRHWSRGGDAFEKYPHSRLPSSRSYVRRLPDLLHPAVLGSRPIIVDTADRLLWPARHLAARTFDIVQRPVCTENFIRFGAGHARQYW